MNYPPPRGKPVYAGCYVDANNAGNPFTRRSHTRIIIYANGIYANIYIKILNLPHDLLFHLGYLDNETKPEIGAKKG